MFRFLIAISKAGLVLLLAGAVFLFVSCESIPDLAATPTPITAEASNKFISAIEKARERTAKTRQNEFYPSLSVSVSQKDTIIWTETIGLADLRQKLAASPETLYPIGSVSKPLTAVLVMKLVDAGRIDLDVTINTYAPSLPDHYHNVTLRQLLSHQAGVRHYGFAFTPPVFTENALNREFKSVEDSLAIFINDPLLFEPDTDFQYSTFGYTLVSYILEQSTDTDFLTLLKELVLDPLELDRTIADYKYPRADMRATDYLAMMRRLGLFQSPKTNSSYKWAGGGLLSTPEELAKLGGILLSGSFISDETFTLMTTARTLPSGELNPQNYGLGWRIGTMPYPRGGDVLVPIIHHGGTAAGSQCALMLVPTFKISVAVCGNAFTGGSGELIQLAADIARDFQDVAAP